ncbi:membrane protein [Bombiscardovia apis]|uniref:Membrane protein n=1 Tax=Bombiscardovia apis TaxID=2932182 RepID=A0ABM8BCB7_9BIFI|nr:PTS sugar transporter subunit IIC [Bombiscardovia apis]BDR54569.1 membrane protein [Bombiscardovia apis]
MSSTESTSTPIPHTAVQQPVVAVGLKAKLYEATMNMLNGLSIGIIVALIPGALLNSLLKYLVPAVPQIQIILTMTAIAQTLLPAVSAVCVGMMAKFTPIQTTSLALAAAIGAGNYHMTPKGISVAGPGDVINLAVTIAVGYVVILLLGDLLKAYTILLIPTLVVLIAGGVGLLTYTPVSAITRYIGIGIHSMTTIQPILMGTLMGAIFAFIIVSPISSVGIAAAISLTGIGAGSANLGIAAAGFALAIYGRKVNSLGTCLAHFLGSPKVQMANLFTRPKLLLPILINAAIMGGLGAVFHVQATPSTAGFGCIGLVGPLAALEGYGSFSVGNIILISVLFVILPIVLGYVSDYICTKFKFHKPQYYVLNYS